MGNDDAANDDHRSSPSDQPARPGWYVVDIGHPAVGNAVPSIRTASTPEREKPSPTGAAMEQEKALKSAIKSEPSSPVHNRQEGRVGGGGGGELPLPVSAARWSRRKRAGSMPHTPGPASNAGSARVVRTASPIRPSWRDQMWQHWRGFVRQVQNAGSASTPSGSLTGTANASNSTHLAGRADGIANEVIRRDMAEKQQAGKLRRPQRRTGTGQKGVTVSSKAGSSSLTRRVVHKLGGPSRAKSATEATGSVRFRSVDGETDRDMDDDDDEDRPRVAPKRHEMLVLDQGFSSSDGWTRRFAHLGPSGFHPSAPSEEFVAEGAMPHNGSATYSATGGHAGEYDDEAGHANLAGCWGSTKFGTWLRWRLWPRLYSFYDMPFISPKEEAAYRKEQWFAEKRVCLLGSAFYIVFGTLTCAFAPKPYDHIIIPGFFAVGLGFAVLLPLTIIYNWPRTYPFLYQVYLWIATWSWVLVLVGDIQLCGYFRHPNTCGAKDFSGVLYAAVSLPSVAILGLGMHRFAHVLGSLAFIILTSIFAAAHSNNWVRNVLNFLFFTIAVQTVHWAKEKSERRVWTLRDQLKKQFRATQKAQVAEAKASDSKKRFTSYVFHEIRVPLNTALLALQNLQNAEVFGTGRLATTPSGMGAEADDSEVEWHALLGSLVMMRKVLDDVLDYSRMDAGRFETVVAPFFFHRSLRSLVHSLNTAARSKGLDFVVELDPNVDEILLESTKAVAREAGDDDSNIYEGASMGDEMRLRQIVTNLCSNATKFTPSGGRVTLRTRLLFPALPSTEPASTTEITAAPTLAIPAPAPAGERLLQQNLQRQDQPALVNTIVVRIEVEDTGLGISPQDLHDLRLFSPYVQTTLGRMQGGKGTGLGLALVRSIVRMSKGRLGVISTKGKGSQFWVELPLGCGKAAYQAQTMPATTPDATTHPSGRVILTQRPTDTERMLNKAEEAVEKGKTLHEHIGAEGVDLKPLDSPGTPDDGMGRFQLPIFTMNGSQPSTTSGATRDSFMTPPPPASAAAPAPAATRPTFARSDKSEQSLASIRSKESKGRATPLASPPLASPGLAPPQWKPAAPKAPSPTPPPPSVASGSVAAPATTAPAPTPRPQASPSAPTIAPLRILLVDDDMLTRRLMSRMLTRQGHICTEAADGHEALVKLGAGVAEDDEEEPPKADVEAAEHRFDLVMLDNFMPGRHSGVDVIRWMRRLGRRDLTVGCTANAEKGDQNEFLEAGLDDILTKPISQAGLLRICTIADTRRRQRSATPS